VLEEGSATEEERDGQPQTPNDRSSLLERNDEVNEMR
jgi:hypothetical protein